MIRRGALLFGAPLQAGRVRLERRSRDDAAPSPDDDAADAEPAQPESTGPAPPLQQRLGPWITIIGVLDDGVLPGVRGCIAFG